MSRLSCGSVASLFCALVALEASKCVGDVCADGPSGFEGSIDEEAPLMKTELLQRHSGWKVTSDGESGAVDEELPGNSGNDFIAVASERLGETRKENNKHWRASFTPGPFGNWTLHGLWPSWDCYAPERHACSPLDLVSFSPELQAKLHSTFLFNESEFRNHEWLKHGCTVMNEMSPEKYFQDSMDLNDRYSGSCAAKSKCEICFLADAHLTSRPFGTDSITECPPLEGLPKSCVVGTAAPAILDTCQVQPLSPQELVDQVLDGTISRPQFDWSAPHDRDGTVFNDYSQMVNQNDTVDGSHAEDDDEAKKPAQFVDPNRWIKDWATGVVVKEIQGTRSRNDFEFLKLVWGQFEAAIRHYIKRTDGVTDRDILFIFKGGNVLRLYAYQVLRNMPEEAKAILHEFYLEKSFRMSDADFSILVRPTLNNFDKVRKDMELVAYGLQTQLRKTFLANTNKWFQLYNRNQSAQTRILQDHLKELKDVASKVPEWADVPLLGLTLDQMSSDGPLNHSGPGTKITDAIMIPLHGRCTAVGCTGLCEPKQCETLGGAWTPAPPCSVEQCPFFMFDFQAPCDGVSFLPITYNDALAFAHYSDRKAHFTLIRTKMLFAVTYKRADGSLGIKKAKGELIDVSIPHISDASGREFFKMLDHPGSDTTAGSTLATHRYEIHPKAFLDPESGEYRLNPKFYEKGGWDSLSSVPAADILAGSVYELQSDLAAILFKQNFYPWADRKYFKRFDRLMFLCFSELLPMSQQGRRFLEEVLAWVSGQASSETMPEFAKDIFYVKLLELLPSRIQKARADGESGLQEFMDRIVANLEVQVKAAQLLRSSDSTSDGFFYDSSAMYLADVGETIE